MSPNERADGRYPPIPSYAFLSDTHTAALVGPDGSVEWFCVPRFDGESVFARVLDRERGGAFSLGVEGAGEPARRYLGDTLVLESRFEAPGGVATAFDFLAVSPGSEAAVDEPGARHVLVRLVRCESGSVRVLTDVNARPALVRLTSHDLTSSRFGRGFSSFVRGFRCLDSLSGTRPSRPRGPRWGW